MKKNKPDNSILLLSVENLLLYLHSKMTLPECFDEKIGPMLKTRELKRQAFVCPKEKGVMKTAYWLERGFALMIKQVESRKGSVREMVVDIVGPGHIFLDPNGFFNNKATDAVFIILKGSVIVPFTGANFAELKIDAPQVDALATCILSENINYGEKKARLIPLRGDELLDAIERVFGKVVWRFVSQRKMASFIGVSYERMSIWRKERG